MHPNKSLGPDGFPNFFFIEFWHIITNDDLIQAIQYFFRIGIMPNDWKRFYITLI